MWKWFRWVLFGLGIFYCLFIVLIITVGVIFNFNFFGFVHFTLILAGTITGLAFAWKKLKFGGAILLSIAVIQFLIAILIMEPPEIWLTSAPLCLPLLFIGGIYFLKGYYDKRRNSVEMA